MQDQESLLYYLSGPEALSDPQQLENLVQKLSQHGYLLFAETETRPVSLAWMLQLDPPWPHWSAAERAANQTLAAPYTELIFTPGVTRQLRQEIDALKLRQRDNLHIYAYAVARTGSLKGHTFDLVLAPGASRFALNYTNDFWTTQRNERMRVEAFDHFLTLVKGLYDVFHPIYAYAWNQNGSIPVTDEVYLAQRKPYILYEINLLGPEMVAHLGGEDHLLRTPAQFVSSFSDGGVFIIPEAPWYPGSLPYTWSKVARYLGVVCPDFAAGDEEDEEE